jgi:apolipoprotein N-acyltransferase
MRDLNEVVDSLFSITSRTISPQTDLILWPENAIDGYIFTSSPIAMRMADSAHIWDTNFIAGSGIYKNYPADSSGLFRGTFQGQPYNIFNAAIFVDTSGFISVYEKANLVPIVERIPFVEALELLDIYDWVNWGKIAGFGKGKTPNMIITHQFNAPGLICYDSVYPSWIREFVNNDATFITIITNDGWWGNTSGHLQHFAYARLRAIEFDRWIARSANNGISGIIAPNGAIIHQTDYWVKEGITGTVYNRHTSTFYSRFGDWLPISALIFTILGFGFTFFQRKE